MYFEQTMALKSSIFADYLAILNRKTMKFGDQIIHFIGFLYKVAELQVFKDNYCLFKILYIYTCKTSNQIPVS